MDTINQQQYRRCDKDNPGTGHDNQTAAAVHSHNRRDELALTAGRFLGPKATMADTERGGVALALSTHTDLDVQFICTDSLAAKQY